MSTAKISAQSCSACGYQLNASTDFTDAVPIENDLSVCLNCGNIAVYGTGLLLRKPTVRERLGIAKKYGAKIAKIRAEILKRGKFYERPN